MIATGIYYGQYTFGSYDLNLKARAHTHIHAIWACMSKKNI